MAEGVDDVHARRLPGRKDARDNRGEEGEQEALQCERGGNVDPPGVAARHAWRRRHRYADERDELSECERDSDAEDAGDHATVMAFSKHGHYERFKATEQAQLEAKRLAAIAERESKPIEIVSFEVSR